MKRISVLLMIVLILTLSSCKKEVDYYYQYTEGTYDDLLVAYVDDRSYELRIYSIVEEDIYKYLYIIESDIPDTNTSLDLSFYCSVDELSNVEYFAEERGIIVSEKGSYIGTFNHHECEDDMILYYYLAQNKLEGEVTSLERFYTGELYIKQNTER